MCQHLLHRLLTVRVDSMPYFLLFVKLNCCYQMLKIYLVANLQNTLKSCSMLVVNSDGIIMIASLKRNFASFVWNCRCLLYSDLVIVNPGRACTIEIGLVKRSIMYIMHMPRWVWKCPKAQCHIQAQTIWSCSGWPIRCFWHVQDTKNGVSNIALGKMRAFKHWVTSKIPHTTAQGIFWFGSNASFHYSTNKSSVWRVRQDCQPFLHKGSILLFDGIRLNRTCTIQAFLVYIMLQHYRIFLKHLKRQLFNFWPCQNDKDLLSSTFDQAVLQKERKSEQAPGICSWPIEIPHSWNSRWAC